MRGKKMKICLIMLYMVVNDLFREIEESSISNYDEINKKIKVEALPELFFSFKFQDQEDLAVKEAQLIKGIIGLETIREKFKEKFEENKEKVKDLVELLYQRMVVKRGRQLASIK